ncbi:MAG: radical SAM protein [Ruminococcus sp.]|nr:radical SAM protein [Ruminococcus sp.]MBQ4105931.1 radical SAM protein [Clostridia bacterium]
MSENNTFKMLIRPAFFVPNIADRFNDDRRVHSIAYGKCNYRCAFCPFDKWTVDEYPEYTLETFEQKVWELLRYSKNFKFTGGEPTLNPLLPDLLKIVKIYGAQTFLDTNGSFPNKLRALINEDLVDIVGISLKGLSAEESAATARITNKKLAWDNVFESIKIASEAKDVSLIITYVACEGYFKESDLDVLADLLKPYPDVTLKINNCYYEEYNDGRRKGLDKSEIYAMVERFVERHPEFRGRTVLFRDHDSCIDQDQIAMF